MSKPTRPDELSATLRQLRQDAGLSESETARRARLTQSKVPWIETGRQMPTAIEVERLCEVYEVPVRARRASLSTPSWPTGMTTRDRCSNASPGSTARWLRRERFPLPTRSSCERFWLGVPDSKAAHEHCCDGGTQCWCCARGVTGLGLCPETGILSPVRYSEEASGDVR